MTTPDAQETSHVELFNRFIAGELAKSEWTHEAHLVTCRVALQSRSPAETVDFLRQAIKAHNCGVGTANTDTSGYHETLTVYYVAAVAAADAVDPSGLNEERDCSRTAALRFWGREHLFSVRARRQWQEPTEERLPSDIEALVADITAESPLANH